MQVPFRIVLGVRLFPVVQISLRGRGLDPGRGHAA